MSKGPEVGGHVGLLEEDDWSFPGEEFGGRRRLDWEGPWLLQQVMQQDVAGTFISSFIYLFNSYLTPLTYWNQPLLANRWSWLGREGAVSLNKGIPGLFFPTQLDLRDLVSEHSPWNQNHAEIQRKSRTPFGCQAHLHRGSGDLLSVKCQY